jgi:hypothetical protein
MEDQDRETRPDEDVEGHVHHEPHAGAPRKDRDKEQDSDDVEAHLHLNAPRKDAPRKD